MRGLPGLLAAAMVWAASPAAHGAEEFLEPDKAFKVSARAAGDKTVEVSGHSDDAFVRVGGRWRFSQRIVHYWNDTELPWAASKP